MARNKYPEVTVEKILEVAKRLFMEKGYEETTIQDIVEGLGGLTKGAIYHHFKSKEDIMDAVSDQMFFENNPFEAVRNRTDLNGLQKMRAVILLNQADGERVKMGKQALPILKNPAILARLIESGRRVLAPQWLKLIEEGNRDGSIHTEFAQELAEVIPLLSDLWLAPSVFPASAEAVQRKFAFIAQMLEKMGLPLIDDEIFDAAQRYFSEWGEDERLS
ncbi:TetR family transcriptional regulator [Beduinella massiliensis]|uniref:TetR family transcriptional regulator n=1 Tax=Beduinella massiliensis TaxID=1852363 RepID=UPI000C8275E0